MMFTVTITAKVKPDSSEGQRRVVTVTQAPVTAQGVATMVDQVITVAAGQQFRHFRVDIERCE